MTQDESEKVERGAAEENSETPLTETEAESSERPPSEPEAANAPDDGS